MESELTPMNDEPAHFEISGHYFLPGQGGFIVGRIVGGRFSIGMRISTGLEDPPYLTIAGIEFLDDVAAKTFKNALIFREQPSLEFVKHVYPVGQVVRVLEFQGCR